MENAMTTPFAVAEDSIADMRGSTEVRYSQRDRQVFFQTFPPETPYLPYEHIYKLVELIEPTALSIIEEYNLRGDVVSLWDSEGIKALFLKGLNPAASIYVHATVSHLCDSLESDKTKTSDIVGIELGCGAGWSTLILWQELHRRGFKNTRIYTVDSSPYAIASTVLLLSYFEIPYVIATDDTLEQYSNFFGVVLHINDFQTALSMHPDNSLGFAYSNHGTSYLLKSDHDQLLSILHSKLEEGGDFVTDSLDPSMRLLLSKPKILLKVLLGGNTDKMPVEKDVLQSRKKGELTEIYWLYGKPERRFMDWLHHLLFHNLPVFKAYMKALSESESTQQVLYSNVGVPSSSLYREDSASQNGFISVPIDDATKNTLPPFVVSAHLRKVS